MAITKVINSESQSYRPVLTDTLVLDAVPTVNSYNSVTSDAVARAIAGASGEVPQVTENDNGKVLKAIYDAGGPAVEWGEATVDQTYDATSTNAQSGTAVAEAIAAIPSATYTAGDGIDITANEVSVKAGNGLSIGDTSIISRTNKEAKVITYGADKYVCYFCQLNADICNALDANSLVIHTDIAYDGRGYGYTGSYYYPVICPLPLNGIPSQVTIAFNGELSVNGGVPSNTDISLGVSTMNIMDKLSYWGTVKATPSDYCLAFRSYDYDIMQSALLSTSENTYVTGGIVNQTTIQDALNVSNPLPTSAIGDAGKVLTVDAAGAAAWATPAAGDEVPTVTSNDNGKVLTATYSGGAGSYAWAAPSGGGVTKQVISLTGATISGTADTTFTFNLAAANQFYALDKLVSVSYKPAYVPTADPAGAKIKLYYGTSSITLDATLYSDYIFCASVFVGNESDISGASDPSLGYKFTKVEIVVPISSSDWVSLLGDPESLKIQILG